MVCEGWSILGTTEMDMVKPLSKKLVRLISSGRYIPISPFRIAGHPLAQNERCLHMFLQEPNIDRNYVPGKIRNA